MGAMRALAVAAALLVAGPAAAQSAPASGRSAAPEGVADWQPLIAEASQRFGVPTRWIERVMRAESGGRTMLAGRPIVSRAGAMGLMQLMPGTWAEMRTTLGLGPDPFDPRDNIFAGTAYLRLMYDRFGYPGLFGAYNTGPGRYAAYLAGRRSLPTETIAYLAAVTGGSREASPKAATVPGRPGMFVVLRIGPDGRPSPVDRSEASVPVGLFAIPNRR